MAALVRGLREFAMQLDEKVIYSLQSIGLTYYGAKSYAALVAIGPSTAEMVAKEAEVPRSKIYDVLKRLHEEGWVKIERGRPLTYRARYPKEAIEERKQLLYADAEYASSELSAVFDRQVDKDAPKVWILRGMGNIIPKIEDMMARAKSDIAMLGALYSEEEIAQTRKYLVAARKRGISVRIITRPKIVLKRGQIDLVAALSPIVPDMKLLNTPFIKFVVVDGREILIIFSRVEDDVPDPDNIVAIWTPNREVSSFMQSNFNTMWDVASPL
ncbi:MAG: Sugar-specific transcriptional regulator TrmB [Methanocella sp. PtaU1.Bin125]|nr:MAG: Sugar-specific transcriptional regulator TrmB [Methanocella sp. PtaU1.Bin125]